MLNWVLTYEDHGLPPETGGMLNQTASFMESLNFFGAEIRQWENKLKLERR